MGQHLVMAMPTTQWSLVLAHRNGHIGPPPFVPPTFEEETFEPRLKLERRMIAGFETLDHVSQMRQVDKANKVFRFAYTRGRDGNGKEKGYFKIPLLRDLIIMNDPNKIDGIKVSISRAEYERSTALLNAVGEMERIARAIPYFGLYKSVTAHLKKDFNVELDDVVLVSVDRGGRIPCLVLQHALGLSSMQSLKVDQGGSQLDRDMMYYFGRRGIFQNKHVLFVDSTVDSGRQLCVLERYFDDEAWKSRLGHRSWSLVGSNEYADDFHHHHNVNWGVDPDHTFEDNPDLMGVDYVPGSRTKVVECPSEAFKAIRACLLSVPAGVIYDAADIDAQIKSQREKWQQHQSLRRAKHEADVAIAETKYDEEVETFKRESAEQTLCDEAACEWSRIVGTKKWLRAVTQERAVLLEPLTQAILDDAPHTSHNILVVGNGKRAYVSQEQSDIIAETLGQHHALFAGTPKGNPGAVLAAAFKHAAKPEVRLYQPICTGDSWFGELPVVYKGQDKNEMREQMVKDSDIVLALGGTEGALREVLLALKFGKPTVLVKGWGPIPDYLLGSKRYNKLVHLHICSNLAEALRTILHIGKI